MRRIKHTLFGSRKRQVVVGILTVVLASSSAFAAWTILTASGSGSTKLGSLVAPTIVNGEVTSTGDLYPSTSGTTASLRMAVSNPNPGPLVLKSFHLDKAAVTGQGNGSCDYNAINPVPLLRLGGTPASGGADFTGLTIPIPTGGPTQIVIPNAIGISDTLPTGCQGTSITGFSVTNAVFSTP